MADNLDRDRLCRDIVDNTSLAIVFGDSAGIIRLWNRGAEAMFGYSAQEALGQSLDLIVPEKHRPKHWDGYHKVMKTGVTKYGRELLSVPAVTKDGRRISVEFNVALLHGDTGQVIGIAATINDVTARWEREKSLRSRMAELEAKVKALEAAAASKTSAA